MTVRHVFLPYCLQRLEDGRYIVLNRAYKPLGGPRNQFVDYATHHSALPILGITAAKAAKLSHNGSADLDCIFLYNDSCVPTATAENWAAYSKRLEVLAALKIKDD